MRNTIKQLQGESDYWRIKFINEQQRSEAAEAKLAEYEKQKAFGFCNEDAKSEHTVSARLWRTKTDAEHGSYGLSVFPLFTRPAPALSLADMVSDEDLKRVFEFSKFVIKCYRNNGEYSPLSSQEPDEIAAILRNIEEAK